MKKLQLTFNNKYQTVHRIGLTKKSEIYKAVEIDSEQQLAIKLEPYDPDIDRPSDIEKQAKIYRLVKGGVGIPNIYWYGIENQYRALVLDIYGPSLEHLLQYCKGKFTLKTVLLIADQIIDRIQWLHSKNLVYNDIDSENFLVGLGAKADKIFIVDLGNCQKFVDEENNHYFISKEPNPIKNNTRFKSVGCHIGKKTSRRDDLESLGYLLVYLLKGELPWDHIVEQDPAIRDLLVKENKASIPASHLCSQIPSSFEKYFGYVKTLAYEEEPDYVWIKRLFKDLFDNSGFTNNKVLDWAERHSY